jgi:hypothetical protein
MGKAMFDAYQQGKNRSICRHASYGKDGMFSWIPRRKVSGGIPSPLFLNSTINHQEIAALPVVHLVDPPALNAAGKKPSPTTKPRSDMKKHLPAIRRGLGAAYWARNSDEAAATALKICSSQQSSGAPTCTLYAINNHYASKVSP